MVDEHDAHRCWQTFDFLNQERLRAVDRMHDAEEKLKLEREANATLRRELTHEREDSAVLRRSYSELLGMICQHCYMNIVPKAGEYRFQCPECDLKVRMQNV